MHSRIIFIPLLASLLTACNQQPSEESHSIIPEPPADVSIIDSNTVVFKTAGGKTIRLSETHPNGQSLTTLKVKGVDFTSGAALTLEDIDPITGIKKTDVDGNGFDEIFIFTTSAGSGSYGNVHLIVSVGDSTLTRVSLPEPEKDDETFNGYMGHDIFMIKDGLLNRTFPVFNEGDSNTSPTGGTRTIPYALVNENGTWQLSVVE